MSKTSSLKLFGVDIERIGNPALKKNICYLSDDCLLVHGRIRHNLTVNYNISDKVMINALHYLKVHKLISNKVISYVPREKTAAEKEEQIANDLIRERLTQKETLTNSFVELMEGYVISKTL